MARTPNKTLHTNRRPVFDFGLAVGLWPAFGGEPFHVTAPTLSDIPIEIYFVNGNYSR